MREKIPTQKGKCPSTAEVENLSLHPVHPTLLPNLIRHLYDTRHQPYHPRSSISPFGH
jgi:hypothetical protein